MIFYQRNPRVHCSSLPDIDFSFWRERDSLCTVGNKMIEIGKTRRTSPCVTCTCTMEGVSKIVYNYQFFIF